MTKVVALKPEHETVKTLLLELLEKADNITGGVFIIFEGESDNMETLMKCTLQQIALASIKLMQVTIRDLNNTEE